VPVLTVKNVGPGCVCHPLYPPGCTVKTCVTIWVGWSAFSLILQSSALSFLLIV